MVGTGDTRVPLEVESSGLTRVPDGAGGAVGPVGAEIVLFPEGYGYGSSVSPGLAIELEGAVGPAVGATTVLLGAG